MSSTKIGVEPLLFIVSRRDAEAQRRDKELLTQRPQRRRRGRKEVRFLATKVTKETKGAELFETQRTQRNRMEREGERPREPPNASHICHKGHKGLPRAGRVELLLDLLFIVSRRDAEAQSFFAA